MHGGPLVFMHVPKCAGSALGQSLALAIGAKTVLHGYDQVLFGDFADFDSISEFIRRDIYLNGLPPTSSCYDLIHGHFALSSLKAAYPDARFVTLMREPRCRLLSHFLYWRGQSDHELLSWGGWSDRVKLAHGRLADFVKNQTLASQVDNLFARFLLCPHMDIPNGAFIAEELYEDLYQEAVAKLDEFGLVDLLENPAMGPNFGRWLGREFHMIKANVSVPRIDLPVSLGDELTIDVLTRLESLSAIDHRLWVATARRVNPSKSRCTREYCICSICKFTRNNDPLRGDSRVHRPLLTSCASVLPFSPNGPGRACGDDWRGHDRPDTTRLF